MSAARPSGIATPIHIGLRRGEPDGTVTIALSGDEPAHLSAPWRDMVGIAAEILHQCVHAAQLAGVPLDEVKATLARSVGAAFTCEDGPR